MTDSPAEKKTDAAGSPATHAVPKARLDEVLAKNKDMAAQLEQARQELEQLRAQPPMGFDENRIAQLAKAAAEEAVGPMRQKAQRLEMGMKLGLQSEAQVEAVAAYVAKGLSEDEALILARTKHKDAFAETARPYDPRMAGILPPGGSSVARSNQPEQRPDYRQQLRELNASTDFNKEKARRLALAAFHEQALRVRDSHA